jgi:hypothetical protein
MKMAEGRFTDRLHRQFELRTTIAVFAGAAAEYGEESFEAVTNLMVMFLLLCCVDTFGALLSAFRSGEALGGRIASVVWTGNCTSHEQRKTQ